MESARSFLQTQGIHAHKQPTHGEEVIFQVAEKKMIADSGDRVLSAQVPTEALQFACGYTIDVILVFDQESRFKQVYIQRFPVRP